MNLGAKVVPVNHFYWYSTFYVWTLWYLHWYFIQDSNCYLYQPCELGKADTQWQCQSCWWQSWMDMVL